MTFSYGSQMDHVTIVAQSGSSDIDTDIAAQNEITSFLFDLMCKAVEIDKYNSYEKNSIRDETSYRGFNEEIIWCLRGDSWICQEKCSRINSQNFFDGYAARG